MTASPMTTRSEPAARIPGALCALGGLALVVLGVVGIGADPGAPVATGVDPWMAVAFLAVALTVAGVLATARVGGTRTVAGRAGLAIALLGTVVFAAAHLLAALVPGQEESPLFPLGQVVQAIGMIVGGIAVLRAGRWAGAGRWMPLVCGLYPFLVLMPAFAVFGAPNFPAIAGFGLCWALLGGALAVARNGAADS